MKMLRYSLLVLLVAFAAPASAIVINEIRVDQTGTDVDEYFELAGTPNQSLAGLTYIVIGDGTPGTNTGVLESVLNLSAMVLQPDGYLSVHKAGTIGTCGGYDTDQTLNFENSDNVTHMLVSGFTGALNQDLDTNDDGILDATPWTAIVDCVALRGPDRTPVAGADSVYCSTVVEAVGGFVPAHVLRCPDTTGNWAAGSFSIVCTYDTPGTSNNCGNLPPIIGNIAINPCAPTAAQQVTVSADVTDFNNNVTSVRVYYKLEAAVTWDSVTATPGTAPNWQAAVPAKPDQSRVLFYIGARDGTGNFVKNPTSAPTGFAWDYRVGVQSIATIQSPTIGDSCGTSTYDAKAVNVVGVVTHVAGEFSDDSFYIQSGIGPNSGIRVFAPGSIFVPTIGDSVRVSGYVDEFRCQTEIVTTTDRFVNCGTMLGHNRRVRARSIPLSGVKLEENESMLVTILGPINVVTAFDSTNFGKEFKVAAGADSTYVGDDTFFPDGIGYTIVPAPGMVLDALTGVVSYRQRPTVPPRENPGIILRLEPRRDNDVDRNFTDAPGPDDIDVVRPFQLRQNSPNPFNPVTTIEFEVPEPGHAQLVIFDARGEVVRRLLARTYDRPASDRVAWDGRDDSGHSVPSGLYFYRLEFGEHSAVRKMLLLR